MPMKGRFLLGALCAMAAVVAVTIFASDAAFAAPLSGLSFRHADPTWLHSAIQASPAVLALRTRLKDLTDQAASKEKEVTDKTPMDDVRRIEQEHAALIAQADEVRAQIAAAEAGTPPAPEAEPPLLAERQRSAAIIDIARRAGYTGSEAQNAISSGTTVEAFRAAAFDAMVSRQVPTSTTRVETDDRDKLIEGATRGLLLRAGIEGGERNEFTGMRLERLAEEALRRANQSLDGNRLQLVGRAFTMTTRAGGMHASGDFPVILEAVANKSMLSGWDQADTTYQIWTKKGSLSDFKIANRYGVGPLPMLKKKPEGTAYEYATLQDSKVTVMLATFGQAFAMTREMVINDDLDAFSDIPRKQGIAARVTVDSLPYALLIANGAFMGGDPIFHANRKNLSGAGGGAPANAAPSADSFEAVATWMRTKHVGGTDGKTRYRIRPKFGIFPVAKEFSVRQLLTSGTELGQTNPALKNRAQGFIDPVFSDWLDDASTQAWYFAADKTQDTVEVSFLDGVDSPFLDQENDWNVDGTRMKVRIDAGASVLDPRGLYKQNGA